MSYQSKSGAAKRRTQKEESESLKSVLAKKPKLTDIFLRSDTNPMTMVDIDNSSSSQPFDELENIAGLDFNNSVKTDQIGVNPAEKTLKSQEQEIDSTDFGECSASIVTDTSTIFPYKVEFAENDLQV